MTIRDEALKIKSLAESLPNAGSVRTQKTGIIAAANNILTMTEPVPPPAPVLTSLAISPAAPALLVDQTQQFTAVAIWSDGSTSLWGWALLSSTLPVLSWSASGGTISNTGLFTATIAGPYTVTVAGGGLTATTTGSISAPAPTLMSLTLSPATVTVAPGVQQQFIAAAVWSDGSTVVPELLWATTGGAITTAGLWLGTSTAGTYTIKAQAKNTTISATATVIVEAVVSVPTLTSLTISPATVTVAPSTAQQFTAAALWSDGSTTLPALIWSATAGVMNTSGLWLGTPTEGSYQVKATGGGLTATASIVVKAVSDTLPPLPNRPGSYTTVVDKALDTTALGWPTNPKWNDPTYMNAVVDADVPVTGKCLEWAYPEGFSDLGSPARAGANFTGRAQLYLAVYLKVSKPWDYHISSVNKLFFIATNADPNVQNEIIIALKGTSETAAQIQVGVQVPMQNSVNVKNGFFICNKATPGYSLGTRHLIEVLAIGNTAGLANGKLMWWVDGVLVAEHTDVRYNTTVDGLFTGITLDPNWGGQGDTGKTQRDWVRMDHLLITGLTSLDPVPPPPSPTLTSIAVSPASPGTLAPGEAKQFTASGTMSDGTTVTPTVSWSCTGGTITSVGLFTAGTGTSYSVTATSGALTASASGAISNTAPPPPSGSILFEDRFMGARWATAQNGYYWTGTNTGSEDLLFLEDGALCFKFGGNTSLADDAFVEKNFKIPDVTRLFVGVDVDTDAAYFHRDAEGADNNKVIRLFGGPAGSTRDAAYGAALEVKTGSSTLPSSTGVSNLLMEFGTKTYSTGNYSLGPWAPFLRSSSSVKIGWWVQVATQLFTTKLPSYNGTIGTNAPVQGDGQVKIWINQKSVFNRTDLPLMTPGGYNRFQYGYLFGWSNSGFTTTTILRVRRFVIATEPLPEYLP